MYGNARLTTYFLQEGARLADCRWLSDRNLAALGTLKIDPKQGKQAQPGRNGV